MAKKFKKIGENLDIKNIVIHQLLKESGNRNVNPKEAEKEYTAHAGELALMQTEIDAAKESYENLVKKVDEAFKNLENTTKIK